jgi:single-stranded-DNA-specific exonuclease
VAQGLQRMRRGQLPAGMSALFQVAGRDAAQAISQDMGFALGPRINAGGRVGRADLGVRLLTTRGASISWSKRCLHLKATFRG